MGWSFGNLIKPFKSLLKAFKSQRGLQDSKDGGRPAAAPMLSMG